MTVVCLGRIPHFKKLPFPRSACLALQTQLRWGGQKMGVCKGAQPLMCAVRLGLSAGV